MTRMSIIKLSCHLGAKFHDYSSFIAQKRLELYIITAVNLTGLNYLRLPGSPAKLWESRPNTAAGQADAVDKFILARIAIWRLLVQYPAPILIKNIDLHPYGDALDRFTSNVFVTGMASAGANP